MIIGGTSSVSDSVAAQATRVKNDGDADDVASASTRGQAPAAPKASDGDADNSIKTAPRISSSSQAALVSLQSSE
jgi:hypothetical protein